MSRAALIGVFMLLLGVESAHAALPLMNLFRWGEIDRLNHTLSGRLLDFSDDHGRDHRFYSPALDRRMSVYVYLPPGYDGTTKFPLLLWLHGANQTQRGLLPIVPLFDAAIRDGRLPPMVIVAPDGSRTGRDTPFRGGSFYLNSKAGNYEDYIIHDLMPWVMTNFAVRPEREAHVIAGASMGGGAAFNLAFKHKQLFRLVGGIYPPLDLRWQDCHGNYQGNYRPDCVGVRDQFPPFKVVARYYGFVVVRQRRLIGPIAGRGLTAVRFIARENPIEMLDPFAVRPDEFDFFIGYGTKDEFNIDAQVEHFVDVAAARGIYPTVVRHEGGHHTVKDGLKLFPAFCEWLNPRLAPWAPVTPAASLCPGPAVRTLRIR
jgi:pimeloyl-ACP methyl ester carboxylesterase